MAEARKVIITCAVTGSIHTPTMTPYLPITPAEIADGAVGAAEAGAAGGAPAAMNALMDALSQAGGTQVAMPATPERVWQAIRDARAKATA